MSFVENYNKELYHHGVKGMKWGVRRKRPNPNNLSDRQIKKYAKKTYAKESLNSNKTAVGRTYDRVTGAHKIHADMTYSMSSKKQNQEAAKQYLKEKNKPAKQKAARVAAKGAKKTAKILGNIGTAYITDQVFNDGMGTRIVKTTVKHAGRAAVSAYVASRGGYDIHWYDN